MKAFWWFQENMIAGMARPGFNHIHWLDLPFDEAVLLGWFGKFSSGEASFEAFRLHLETYVPKIFRFHGLDNEAGFRAIQIFSDQRGFCEVLDRVSDRTQVLRGLDIRDTGVRFEINPEQLQLETDFLKDKGIRRIVSLTEQHHNRDLLGKNFDLVHIGIEDLGAPKPEQVHALAEILWDSKRRGEKIAVHCLAGIGRTSTMLLAAHLSLGENFEDLKTRLSKQNPRFILTGPQADFIRGFQAEAAKVQVVAAVIRRGPYFLLGKRSLNKKSASGRWSPISGRVEAGETQRRAVERECQEEVGLTVRADRKVAELDRDDGATRLHWWLVEVVTGEESLKNDEHSELRWFTIDEMKKEAGFLPEDIEIYSKFPLEQGK